jgi:hypothetical protein
MTEETTNAVAQGFAGPRCGERDADALAYAPGGWGDA